MIMRQELLKKNRIISVACVLYAAAVVAIYYSVDKSIDEEVRKLKDLALENLDYFFKDKPMYVDLLYGPYGFDYKKMDIPKIEEPSYNDVTERQQFMEYDLNIKETYDEAYDKILSIRTERWKKEYGEFTRMYDLDIFPDESERSIKSGWVLKIVKKLSYTMYVEGGCIQTYLIFPKQVAYKKYGQVCSLETAVGEALNFEIKNEKSELQPYYERGSTYNLISKMESSINNKYYYFSRDSIPQQYYSREFLGGSYDETYTVGCGRIHNAYYQVNFHRTQPTTYSIKFVGNDVVQRDKYIRMAIYIGILTIIMAGVMTFIVRKK